MPNAYNIDTAEDITGQAGWMFSDMLVALMVVFLATISFIPQFGNQQNQILSPESSSSPSSGTYTYTEHFDTAYVHLYDANNVSTVLSDIQQFAANNKIPLNAVIDSAQFVGGYNQETETSAQAIERARVFAARLDKAFPTMLENASTILNSSPKLAAGNVTVRFTFSGKVTTER